MAWLALIPWAAFLVATYAASVVSDVSSPDLAGLALSAPLYLAFVALPVLAPLSAARRRWMIVTVTVVTTVTAAVAGVLVATTDDAQAGLAVLWVPYVALPLWLVVRMAEWLLPRARSVDNPSRVRDRS
jgi:hypothetical protein